MKNQITKSQRNHITKTRLQKPETKLQKERKTELQKPNHESQNPKTKSLKHNPNTNYREPNPNYKTKLYYKKPSPNYKETKTQKLDSKSPITKTKDQRIPNHIHKNQKTKTNYGYQIPKPYYEFQVTETKFRKPNSKFQDPNSKNQPSRIKSQTPSNKIFCSTLWKCFC